MNSKDQDFDAGPWSYVRIEREWHDGDTVLLALPMRLTVRTWARNHDSVSIDYGPLTFSLAIGERWSCYGSNDKWPEQEVFATTPWNYGLVVDKQNPAASVTIESNQRPLADQPFTPEASRIRLHAKARRIPNWAQDSNGLLRTLHDSPVKSGEPLETIALIPMGAARLRITAFPTIGDSADAHEWTTPTKPPTASHCFDSLIGRGTQRWHPSDQIERHRHPAVHLVGPSRNARMGTIRFRLGTLAEIGGRLLVRRHRFRQLPRSQILAAGLQAGQRLESGRSDGQLRPAAQQVQHRRIHSDQDDGDPAGSRAATKLLSGHPGVGRSSKPSSTAAGQRASGQACDRP